jgi:hypothetical protein
MADALGLVSGLNDLAVMGETVEERCRHLGITDHRRMPHFLMGIYLMSRLQTLVTVFTGSVLS